MELVLYLDNATYGADKVCKNLLKGLNLLNISYILNPNFDNKYLNDEYVIYSSNNFHLLNTNLIFKSNIGPNYVVLPTDNSKILDQNYKKFLLPSQWTYEIYKKWIDPQKLELWAVGIDTDLFRDCSSTPKNNDCLIYYKNQFRLPVGNSDLNIVINLLKKNNQSYKILNYGQYQESTFLQLLSESKYSIVIDGTESQGIAIQEIMSSNIPLLVLDCNDGVYNGQSFNYLSNNTATSIPYWDDICGIKNTNINYINDDFDKFINNINTYNPRQFILDNLTLVKCAQNLLNIVNYK